jgi:hypothetical protein
LAIEALKIALGDRERAEDGSAGDPWTRPWALGHATDVEWLAVIYSDVTLDADRWRFAEGSALSGTQRIIVGAPVWVQTASPPSTVRYAGRRGPSAGRATGWRRLVPSRRASAPVAATVPSGSEASSGQLPVNEPT